MSQPGRQAVRPSGIVYRPTGLHAFMEHESRQRAMKDAVQEELVGFQAIGNVTLGY